MAKPAPRQNFFQSLLLMLAIFFGLQLLFPQNRGAAGVDYFGKRLETRQQIKDALFDADAKIYDVTANTLLQAYDGLLNKEVADKKITAAEADRERIQATLLTASAQTKAGIARNDSARLRNAYHTLVNLENKRGTEPIWKETFPVADASGDPRFGWKAWSGHGLYQDVVARISARSKTDLIWGVIPGGYALVDGLVRLTGSVPGFSYAFAGFLLALLVRAAVWPLAQKQLMFGRQMQRLVPLVNDIKAQYPDDPQMQQRKTMELYSEYGVNPLSGCGPALVQIPLFLTVYQCMLLYQFEFQKGTFLWINPESHRAFPSFFGPNLGQLDALLIVIYGVMMIVSTLMTPVSDPTQVKQQRLMGIGVSVFFTVMMFFGLFPVPGGFVLYWIFLLVLSSLQSWRAYRLPLPELKKVNTATGGVYAGAGGKPKTGWAARMEELMRQAQDQQAARGGGAPAAKPTVQRPTSLDTGSGKTGTPAKHKPKKRK